MKKLFLVIPILISLLLLVILIAGLLKNNTLNSQLKLSKNLLQRIQGEMEQVKEEKDKVTKEKDKLQSDTLSYLALNTKLEEEKNKSQINFEESAKIIKVKEDELNAVKERINAFEKQIEEKKEELSRKEGLVNEKKELRRKIILMGNTLKKERALYHYNLGVAYSQAKFYDEAIGEYEKSLKYSSANANAHYNLGLLYENIKKVPEQAIEHYRKYLEIKPDTADKEEVEGWIKKLEAIIRAKTQKR